MGREQTDTDCGLYIPDIGTLYLRCNEYHEGRRYVFASRARVVVWNLTSAKVRQLVEAPSISLFPSSPLSFYRVPLYQRIIPNVAKHSPRPSLGYVLCKRNPRTEGLPKCFASAEASSIGACIGLSDAPFFFLFLFYSSVTKGAV